MSHLPDTSWVDSELRQLHRRIQGCNRSSSLHKLREAVARFQTLQELRASIVSMHTVSPVRLRRVISLS